ncbi:MAG: hypothetical protein JSW33_08735 [bacterium]|nr:MAG: hypothetical protein JSW33_08735 [bacterium]
MRKFYSRTATKVKRGTVQFKNRWEQSPNIYNAQFDVPFIDKEKPGRDYKHLLRKHEVAAFLELLPKWEQLSQGLNVILLASGEYDTLGWHENGIVAICAWDRDIYWENCEPSFLDEHKRVFSKLSIPFKCTGKFYEVDFTIESAKDFQLVHVLVHELGHHHDRMTTKSKIFPARGESFAESYAKEYENEILSRYRETFNYI